MSTLPHHTKKGVVDGDVGRRDQQHPSAIGQQRGDRFGKYPRLAGTRRAPDKAYARCEARRVRLVLPWRESRDRA